MKNNAVDDFYLHAFDNDYAKSRDAEEKLDISDDYWIQIDESRDDDCCYKCNEKNYYNGAYELFKNPEDSERIGICYTCGSNYSCGNVVHTHHEMVEMLSDKQRKYLESKRAEILDDLKNFPPEKRE